MPQKEIKNKSLICWFQHQGLHCCPCQYLGQVKYCAHKFHTGPTMANFVWCLSKISGDHDLVKNMLLLQMIFKHISTVYKWMDHSPISYTHPSSCSVLRASPPSLPNGPTSQFTVRLIRDHLGICIKVHPNICIFFFLLRWNSHNVINHFKINNPFSTFIMLCNHHSPLVQKFSSP